jgi:hypothetical protein
MGISGRVFLIMAVMCLLIKQRVMSCRASTRGCDVTTSSCFAVKTLYATALITGGRISKGKKMKQSMSREPVLFYVSKRKEGTY